MFRPKMASCMRFHVVQFTIQGGIDHAAGMVDVHAFANPVTTACPAGIHQPAGNPVLVDFFTQQVGVNRWVQCHERCTKAGAEGGASVR